MEPSRERPMAHRPACRRAARAAGVLMLAAALASPALAQKDTRGLDTNPPPASVRIVDQVNQSFTLPYPVTVFGSPDASRAPVGRLDAGATVEVVGVVEVAREAYPDPSAEAGSPWVCVDMKAVAPMPKPVTLAAMKAEPSLADIALIRMSRLSVMPISDEHWAIIAKMGGLKRI